MSDNSNNVLRAAPWVVVADDGVASGIVDRFATEGDASEAAEARTKAFEDAGITGTTFTAVDETADPAEAAPKPKGDEQ